MSSSSSFLKNSINNYQNAYPAYQIEPEFSGYSMNNKYRGFPPLMSDGRSLVGAYTPESVTNASLMKTNGITNNWQYRQFMTQNSEKIHDLNFNLAANDIGYTYRSLDLTNR